MSYLNKNLTLHISFSSISQSIDMHFSKFEERDLYPTEQEAMDIIIKEMDEIIPNYIYAAITKQTLQQFKHQAMNVINLAYQITGIQIELNDTRLNL